MGRYRVRISGMGQGDLGADDTVEAPTQTDAYQKGLEGWVRVAQVIVVRVIVRVDCILAYVAPKPGSSFRCGRPCVVVTVRGA